MMMEAGFHRGDATVRLGQLAESLVRLARFVVGIRLHCEDLSVEQGMRIFRDEAFLEEATARREAERGTFDPTYLVYSAGKLMMLKLRRDYKEQQGAKVLVTCFSRRRSRSGLRAVQGPSAIAPERRVGRVIGIAEAGEDAALRVSVRGVRSALRADSEVLRSARQTRADCAEQVRSCRLILVARDSVQGQRLVHH